MRACEHKESLVSKIFRINTVSKRHALVPIDGVIYWHLREDALTTDVSKQVIIESIEKGFKALSSAFDPIEFKPTSSRLKAPIQIFFMENGDKRLPEKFDSSTLAYAFLPQGRPAGVESDMYFNDALHWSKMHEPGKYSLFTVFAHEVLHALGLHHSKVKNDIMYPTYQNTNNVFISRDTQKGIDKLYGKVKKEIRNANKAQETFAADADFLDFILSFLRSLFPHTRDLNRLSIEQLATINTVMGLEESDSKRDLIRSVNAKLSE